MGQYSDRGPEILSTKKLERELNLKQLQINSLLSITQAINENLDAPGLFKMYKNFLTWEMEIKKMALFILQDGQWICVSQQGVLGKEHPENLDLELARFEKLQNLSDEEDPFFQEFDVVIPVKHKKNPIAFTFIGGFEDDDDLYNKIQFITTITNIIAVAIENKRLFKRQLEQTRLEREMELASEMQKMLVARHLPKTKQFELSSIYKPKLGVGGDYYDCIELDEENVVFCVADISGKGVAAALLMANFQAIFHTLICERKPMDIFINELNTHLYRTTGGDKFLTLFVAVYNKKTHQLKYVNAGHNPPILVREGEAMELDKGCPILGGLSKLPSVEVGEVDLIHDCTLCTFTDGLTDTQNEAKDYFTQEMILDFTIQNAALDAEAFNTKLFSVIDAFKFEEDYPDDLTVLTCKITAP